MHPIARTRETTLAILDSRLAPYATPNAGTGRRRVPEPDCPVRTAFQRDVGRVVHCASFRRLQYCTQVFLNDAGDYYRTRLTHAIAVAQIGKTIGRALGANEDLVEAIALAHDIGHPPFGHAGEMALDQLMREHGHRQGFEHNLHGLRVLDELETRAPGMRGLNLTYEVREGVARHLSTYDEPAQTPEFPAVGMPRLECQIVNLADPIAYRSHDLDDALATGVLSLRDLDTSGLDLWERVRSSGVLPPDATDTEVRIHCVRGLIEVSILSALRHAEETLWSNAVDSPRALAALNRPVIELSEELLEPDKELAGFLHDRMYRHPVVARMNAKGKRTMTDLFRVLMEEPEALGEPFRSRVLDAGEAAGPAVCDFLAMLTDRSALDLHADIFDARKPSGVDLSRYCRL